MLLAFFRPELILSATTTAGGDTGAHHYVADFLINHLLPKGRVTGWSPGWYAGFPMLHFYFPFPFLLIALFSTIIKYEIAFKLVTILGVFLLPATTYWAFRILKFKFPLPLIASGFTLPFLFMESYSIYGGNILSTLAGEFGYSLSFSLTIFFLALLYRDIREEKFRVSTGVLLGIIALSHLVPMIMIVILATYYLLNGLNLKRFTILAGVFSLGFALTAFWGLPFLAKLGYTAHMEWDQLTGLNELFPPPVRPFLILSAIGLTGAIVKRDSRMYFFLWATVVSASLFFLLPPGRLWNGRLLPFFYYFSFIWAAYGVWFLRRFLAQLFYEYFLLPKRYADYLTAAIAITITSLSIFGSSHMASDWIRWNYSGFEGKKPWASFNAINQYIKKLPPGRVMVEHSIEIDKFGTPRAFELLPYFAGKPTMEGTLMEASFTAPFHFVNQAELSKEPSHAILGVTYPGLNVDDGIRHLQLYNIRYFLALSDEVKREAGKNQSLRLLKTFQAPDTDIEIALYEVDIDGYVTIPKYEPLLVKTDDWRQTALDWYAKPELLEIPLIDADRARPLKGKYQFVDKYISNPVKVPVNKGGSITNVRLKDDALTFSTTAIGLPHWIKISYFPNWKAEGADGPYLASPSLMMVIPREETVRLYYGSTLADIIGAWLSAIGWLFVVTYAAVFAWQNHAVRIRSILGSGKADRSNA
ncbi:MAG: hypothetical protein IBX64_10255 [Actinobacteria bacterium]|nr:hypothetical protein [Actinomycetota bacterium]